MCFFGEYLTPTMLCILNVLISPDTASPSCECYWQEYQTGQKLYLGKNCEI
jgi:hypothetical protein